MEAETLLAWFTLIAVLAGPILAVLVTRFVDSKREKKKRKLEVFRDLMATRGIRLNPQHVSALNIVEVEFYNCPKVRNAFKSYIEHLSAPMPIPEEQVRFFDERTDKFMDLLHELGLEVGFKFDKRELERKSYVPVGWGNDEEVQRGNARMLHELLSGRRPLPVTNHLANNPYPDPPEIAD